MIKNFKELEFAEQFFALLLAAVSILVIGIIARPDKLGVEVLNLGTNYFKCEKVLPYAFDQTIAICATGEECNRVCSNLTK